jgi:anti-sigma factor RsiW
MTDHDPIDPLERQLWVRFAGPPSPPGPGAGTATCPSAVDLAAYLDGRLAEAERDVLEAHMALCGPCRELVYEGRENTPDEPLAFVPTSLIETIRALRWSAPAAQRRGWAATARWSFAAAASLAMALLAFQAGASSAGAARPAEDVVLSEMSFGLLGPAEPWEPGLDPLPAEEDLP